MPIFQKKAQDGRKAQKVPPKTVTPVPTGTGGRRSLSMVGKALADVVNNRKANYSPPKPSVRTLAKVIESSSDAYESSTALDSSLAGKPNRRVSSNPRSSGSVSSTRATPRKRDETAVSRSSPSKGVGRSTPIVTRGGLRKDGTPSPTTSRGRSGSGAPFRTSKSIDLDIKLTREARSPTLRRVENSSPSTSVAPSVVGSPASPISPNPPDTMTIESNVEEALPSPLDSVSVITRASSVKVMRVSALPQPKVRPRSTIFAAAATLVEPPEATKERTSASLIPSEKCSSAGDNGDRSPIAGPPRLGSRKTTSSNEKVVASSNESKGTHRGPSPAPSARSMIKRPFSPLPKPIPSETQRGTSKAGSADELLKADSDTSDNHKPSIARSSSITAKRRSGLPRPSSVCGAVVSQATGESSKGIAMRAISSRRTARQEDSSASDERSTSFKKRRSDVPSEDSRNTSRKSNNALMSPQRLAVPTSRPPRLPAQPKTPSTFKVEPRVDQTFSIPRNRLINFSFVNMTLPNDMDTLDEVSLPIENSISSSHHDPDASPLSTSSSLPTLFLPPSRPYQSPGPSHVMSRMVRRGRPSTAPVTPRTTRPSLPSFDAIVERSREYLSDIEVNAMLSEVPAPFTPDVHGSSLLLTTPGSSELSFHLDHTNVQTTSCPPSPMAQSFHSQRSVMAGSISQLLFPPSTNPSVMSSPRILATVPSSHPKDLTTTEREVMELRLKVAAHETAARAQGVRVANLEAEVATAYSVTRSRESTYQVGLRKLAGGLAHRHAEGTKKDWNYVAELARMEQDCLAAERSALHALALALDVNMVVAPSVHLTSCC